MARLRTPEEREEIALECIRLEQEGGDILAYLWSQDYYSPRATWCNIQRQYLNRKPYEFTDGKPRKTGRKAKPMPRKGDMRAIAEAVAEEIEAGKDYKIYMEGLGYKEPQQAIAYIRKQIRKTNPELADRLYVRKPQQDVPQEAEEREKSANILTIAAAPAKQEGTDLTPVAFDGLVGRWNKESDGMISLSKQRDGNFFFMIMEMSLTAKEWMAICAEIPRVIEKMGLQEAAREN